MIDSKIYCFGEVLWDKFPSGKKPGGAPLNVAYHAKNLGLASYLCSAIGNDDDGRELLDFINKSGLNTNYVSIVDEHPTGTVTVNVANPKEVSYTIDGPSAWDFIDIQSNLIDQINWKDFIVFGTLSSRSIENRNTLNTLLKSPAYKVMDLNLRPPHYTKSLVGNLLSQTDLLKVNREEYEQLASWFNIEKEPSKGFKDLSNLFNITELVITSGSQGSRFISKTSDVTSETFEVDCTDTVGAGDSFLAALIYGLIHNTSPQKMVDFASGLGALVASKIGATPQLTKQNIEDFIKPISTCTK